MKKLLIPLMAALAIAALPSTAIAFNPSVEGTGIFDFYHSWVNANEIKYCSGTSTTNYEGGATPVSMTSTSHAPGQLTLSWRPWANGLSEVERGTIDYTTRNEVTGAIYDGTVVEPKGLTEPITFTQTGLPTGYYSQWAQVFHPEAGGHWCVTKLNVGTFVNYVGGAGASAFSSAAVKR
jgi:hypothetical protein